VKRFLFILGLWAPLLASAQLPMLLDQGRPSVIGVPPNQAYNGYIGDLAYFYGDSVTRGYNPNPPQTNFLTGRFAQVLCTNLSMIEVNASVGGSEIADAQADNITTNNSISNSSVSVWLAGYNDVFWFGTNAAALTDNLAAVESLAAWLAIPTAFRVAATNIGTYSPTNSIIYYPPGWYTGSPLPALGGLEYSTQPNAASFFFSGSTLLIGTARLNSGAGNVVVTVGDYVNETVLPPYATNVYSCVRTSPDTGPGPPPNSFGNRTYSPGLIIITNLTANRHYAFFTPQTSAYTFLGWYASYSTNQLPKVVLAGSLKLAGSNWTDPNLPAGYMNGSDLAANEYSLMLSNAAAVLSAAQLNVKWVPVPVLDSNVDYFFDGIHPDVSGHQKLETAIQAGF
jgi:lysophospholipase L1-like esterase